MVTSVVKRDAVAHAREHHGLSERRACNLVCVGRRVIRYRSSRPDDGSATGAAARVGGGASPVRLSYVLARGGITPHHKKLLRVHREENLRVRRRGARKRALGTRAPMVLPDGSDQRWSRAFFSETPLSGAPAAELTLDNRLKCVFPSSGTRSQAARTRY